MLSSFVDTDLNIHVQCTKSHSVLPSCQLSVPIIVHMCNLLCECVCVLRLCHMCEWLAVKAYMWVCLFRFAKQFVLLRPMSVVAGAESSSFSHGLCVAV